MQPFLWEQGRCLSEPDIQGGCTRSSSERVEGEGCFLKRDAPVWVCGRAALVFALHIHAKVCICLVKAFRVPVSTGELILCGIVCATGILLRVGTFVAKCLQKRRLLVFLSCTDCTPFFESTVYFNILNHD